MKNNGLSTINVIVRLYKMNYPYGSDGKLYDTSLVNADGWLAGYKNSDGDMGITGTIWNTDIGKCKGGTMISNATDPLGKILYDSGSIPFKIGSNYLSFDDITVSVNDVIP